MTPPLPPDPPDGPSHDPLTAYVDGEPRAVRAARPPEPSEAQWEAVRRRVRARLRPPVATPESAPGRRAAVWFAVGATLAAAAAVVWLVLAERAPRTEQVPREVVVAEPVRPEVPVAPRPHDPPPDSLAEFAVLPMAGEDEVVLHRVPGDGWLPVGSHPLSGALELATADDVELDEPDPARPGATPAPGCSPMIYAAKPR